MISLVCVLLSEALGTVSGSSEAYVQWSRCLLARKCQPGFHTEGGGIPLCVKSENVHVFFAWDYQWLRLVLYLLLHWVPLVHHVLHLVPLHHHLLHFVHLHNTTISIKNGLAHKKHNIFTGFWLYKTQMCDSETEV